MTARQVEIAVAEEFGWRKCDIVPNVYWGWGLNYEADLVVMRKSGWCLEIEIKVTRSDIKADLKKKRQHNSNKFRELWFAVPKELADDPNIPERAGIIAVTKAGAQFYANRIRMAQTNPDAIRADDKERMKLLRLGNMRVWGIKKKIADNNGQGRFDF